MKKGGDKLSKAMKMVAMVLVLTAILTLTVANVAFADSSESPGPAPNSGDGIPDGPGFPDGTIPFGPPDEIVLGSGPTGPLGDCLCLRDQSCQ